MLGESVWNSQASDTVCLGELEEFGCVRLLVMGSDGRLNVSLKC
jgi:hypothetical protein